MIFFTGETDKLVELLMEGYDHILDTEDDGKNILQIAEEEDNTSTVEFLKSIENYTVWFLFCYLYN